MVNTLEAKSARKAHGLQSAAAQLDVSVPFLRKQIRLGNLKAKRVSRRILILDDELESYLNASPEWKGETDKGDEK